MKTIVGTVLFGFILLFSTTVYALDVGIGMDMDAETKLDVDANGVEAEVDLSADAEGDASTSGEMSDESTTTGEDADEAALLDAEASLGSIVITRASASSETGAIITSPSTVQTSEGLSVYASTVVKSDEHVDSVELSDSAVALEYKVRAYLFGFIPMLMPVTAEVTASGETTVGYPWYSFLASADSASSLESDVQAATAATLAANVNTAFSASTQAKLLDEIHTAMKSKLEASLATEATAGASTQ